jgi:hypothetical protein
MKYLRLLAIFVALMVLGGLTFLVGGTEPTYAGGPEATPTCECIGGEAEVDATPVPNKSSIVGYAYDYSTGPPIGRKGLEVKLTGCSWSATWGTDDNGYFYFDNLGFGVAHVDVQLPPGAHAVNPNVVVQTSGVTETYTVYLGYYFGDTPPKGPFTTPNGLTLSGGAAAGTPMPGGSTSAGAPLPNVGGTLPDSYLVIGLSALLLMGLPVAGMARMGKTEDRGSENTSAARGS